jgi:hypothetical protein
MLYREIIAVCSEIHTKHINTLCGQNAEFVNVTTGFWRVKRAYGSNINTSTFGSLYMFTHFMWFWVSKWQFPRTTLNVQSVCLEHT